MLILGCGDFLSPENERVGGMSSTKRYRVVLELTEQEQYDLGDFLEMGRGRVAVSLGRHRDLVEKWYTACRESEEVEDEEPTQPDRPGCWDVECDCGG